VARFILAIVAASVLLACPARADDILIIANASVTANTPLDTGRIAAMYLLRVTTWPDGTRIVPVNREAGSDLRAQFTADVLMQDNSSLAAYWNEMHFMGKMPPVVQQSEQAMIAFVRRVPGAIGYISAGVMPPPDVKVLARVH
jgi:ABC-type phosphate transport system substrate-binding protein